MAEPNPGPESLRRAATRGLFWSGIEKWGTHLLSFLVLLVLARLVGPEAFGLVGMCIIFILFFQIVIDQGFSDAIVQAPEVSEDTLSTAFWTIGGMGILLCVVGLALAKPIALLYGIPEIAPIFGVLSCKLVFEGFRATQVAILTRRMEFHLLAKRTLAAQLVGSGAGLAAGFWGWGAWSLVVQNMVGSLVGLIVLWRIHDWRPQFRFSPTEFRRLVLFGYQVTINRMIGFTNRRIYTFLIGYFMGPLSLGFFSMANGVVQRLQDLLTGVTSSVALSTFSKLQSDLQALRRAYYKATQFKALIAFPAFIGLSLVSHEVVVTVVGPDWVPGIPILRLLAVISAFETVIFLTATLVVALGSPRSLAAVNFCGLIALLGFFPFLYPQGLTMVVGGYAVVRLMVLPVTFGIARHLAGLRTTTFLSQFIFPALGTVAMAAALFVFYQVGGERLSPVIRLLGVMATGVVAYGLAIWLIRPQLVREILTYMREWIPSRFEAHLFGDKD